MTDMEALSLYEASRDTEAFRQLVLNYQEMVYATCHRILGNPSDAEDAVQETFIKLANSAGRIRKNLVSWLYTCAVHTALNQRQADRSRRAREETWAKARNVESADDWHEVFPVVDACIAELPEDDRALLLQHYLGGRSQRELARKDQVSQPAIRKRLQRTVLDLRRRLSGKGVTLSGALLGDFLRDESIHAAVPDALTGNLCKIGLAGVGSSPGAVSSTSGDVASPGAAPVFSLKAKLLTGVGILALAGLGTHLIGKGPPTEQAPEIDRKAEFRTARAKEEGLPQPDNRPRVEEPKTTPVETRNYGDFNTEDWTVHNTDQTIAEFKGKKALRLRGNKALACVRDVVFEDGTIEVDIATPGWENCYVGVAFRVRQEYEKDLPLTHNSRQKYEYIYFRPHLSGTENAIQYCASGTKYNWSYLRENHPGVYEGKADLPQDDWFHVRIVVSGSRAEVYVNDAKEPQLVVKELKHGLSKGSVGVYSYHKTAYFANFSVTPRPAPGKHDP